jgi:hypothetical protein
MFRKSCGFSIEINSKKHLRDISLSNSGREAVLIEGDLGPLKDVSFFEDKVLIVKGSYGTLRAELSRSDISDLIFSKDEKSKNENDLGKASV